MVIKRRLLEGMTIYRFLINIGIFILFVAVMTVIVHKHVAKRSYSLRLKKSVFILNEAMRYVTTQPFEKDDGNDIYYWYLADAIKRNLKSFECGKSNRSKNKACPAKDYQTMNGKASMSELVYKNGIDIVVDDKLRTSMPGVWAAGDVRTGAARQIVSAAGDGAVAAIQIGKYLRGIS